jgi:hypothetical protein
VLNVWVFTCTFTLWKGLKKQKQRTEVAACEWMAPCAASEDAPWPKTTWWAMHPLNGSLSGPVKTDFGNPTLCLHWIKQKAWRQTCSDDASIQAVGHHFDAKGCFCQFNGLELGGADVNAVVSHVDPWYGPKEDLVSFVEENQRFIMQKPVNQGQAPSKWPGISSC